MNTCKNCGASGINCAFCMDYSEWEERKEKQMTIKVKKLSESALIPTYGSELAAGADLYCSKTTKIDSHAIVKVPTDIAIEPDNEDCAVLVFARSGKASKEGITLANGVGVVDSDYRGGIMCAMINNSSQSRTIYEGERMAQLVVVPIYRPQYEEAEELSETTRGNGGFGSTGK